MEGTKKYKILSRRRNKIHLKREDEKKNKKNVKKTEFSKILKSTLQKRTKFEIVYNRRLSRKGIRSDATIG